MTTKRAKLTDFAAQKPAPAVEAPAAAPDTSGPKAPLKGMTLRLNEPAWKQLKGLAIDEGRPAHDILIDAVNDYFRKSGKPPIA